MIKKIKLLRTTIAEREVNGSNRIDHAPASSDIGCRMMRRAFHESFTDLSQKIGCQNVLRARRDIGDLNTIKATLQ